MSEETEFPKSIKGFGYNFNEKGELRNIETDERFLFFVKPEDRSYNQRHYEELGEVIGEFIEDELVNKYKLIRKIIPVGLEENEESDDIAKSRIYLSDDAQECQTLLLLIQGSGVVRPGQWARQVIINDSLELGTMFPYIKKAQDLKWGIVIFNPNENYGCIMKDGKVVDYRQIPGSESPLRHCLYVWDKFVKDARAEKIVIVAHSYGGICTTYMLDRFAEDFKLRVKGIALTDSVHSSGMVPSHSKKWFEKNAFNWIKSSLPLSEPVYEANQYYGCKCVSAGHPKHEYTSGHAFEAVFEYLEFRLKEKRKVVTNQENETGEQSSIANNKDTTAEIDSIKTQTQDGNSITHEKDTTTTEEGSGSAMEIGDETNAAIEEPQTTINKTNEISSENDITVIKEPQLDPMEIVEPDSNSAMEIGDEYNTTIEESQIDSNSVSKATDTMAIEEPRTDSMEIVIEGRQTDSNSVSKATDTMATEEPRTDSMEIVIEGRQTDSNSAMEIADEIPKTSINEGPQPDSNSAMNELPNTDTEKPQIDSDSTMEIVNELPKTATKKQTNETSSEKDTKKDAEKPQLDPMNTTEKDTVAKNNISENEVAMINDISKETDSTANVQAFKDDNSSEQHRSNETS